MMAKPTAPIQAKAATVMAALPIVALLVLHRLRFPGTRPRGKLLTKRCGREGARWESRRRRESVGAGRSARRWSGGDWAATRHNRTPRPSVAGQAGSRTTP